jgi:4-amino-4-deoxy-L-arabinose transferase-like glycosyltransferase
VSSRRASQLAFFLAFAAVLLALHVPYLNLPFHWDELGQFVPASLDLYREGSWVPHSTLPNVHPPGIMAILAAVWSVTGYSIRAARVTMLLIASLGVFVSFLLAIRLARGSAGAPAFAAVIFLMAAPVFYTQSMLVLLDMPAMTFTILSLLLFLNRRYAWAAAAATLAALMKETTITTPLIFAAWLWWKDGRRREALYFTAPALALGIWLLVLHRATGQWLGNREFMAYNVGAAVAPLHIAASFFRNLWALFLSNGRFLGSLALISGWRLLRGRDWSIAFLVAAGQFAIVTVFGAAMLERYLLPAVPVVFAAMAVAASACRERWRWVSQGAMAALLLAGWFLNPPYPSQLENLALVDFVRLQREAAQYLEAYEPHKRIASAWPFTDAIHRPDFGYVQAPLQSVRLEGLDRVSIAAADRSSYDLLVTYSRQWPPPPQPFRGIAMRYFAYRPEASEEDLRAAGLTQRMKWTRGGQWIAIYGP